MILRPLHRFLRPVLYCLFAAGMVGTSQAHEPRRQPAKPFRHGLEAITRQNAEASLRSPLLDHNLISGAKNILLNISVSNADGLMYEEVVQILEYIQAHASVQDEQGVIHNANIIWGTSEKPQLGNAIELVVVATGFEGDAPSGGKRPVIPVSRIVEPVPAAERVTTPPQPLRPGCRPRPWQRPCVPGRCHASPSRHPRSPRLPDRSPP